MQRNNYFNARLMAGKLTQQYIVDQYVKIESQRLKFIRGNQNTLRVELYSGLMDQLANHSEGQRLGKMFVLPSSFSGGARYM